MATELSLDPSRLELHRRHVERLRAASEGLRTRIGEVQERRDGNDARREALRRRYGPAADELDAVVQLAGDIQRDDRELADLLPRQAAASERWQAQGRLLERLERHVYAAAA